MVVVATPVYRVSRFCGPITDTVSLHPQRTEDSMNYFDKGTDVTTHSPRPPEGRAIPWRNRFGLTLRRTLISALIAATVTACSSKRPAADTGSVETGTTETAARVDMSAVKVYELPAPVHVETAVVYPQSPPVGGDHNPAWQNCGFYPDAVQNETAVHSMEHGAVWITYRPDLATAEVDTLRALTANQPYLLITPFPGLTSPVVLTAWGHQLAVDSASDPRFAAFVSTYQQGAQTLEPGAPCTGAIGQPQ